MNYAEAIEGATDIAGVYLQIAQYEGSNRELMP